MSVDPVRHRLRAFEEIGPSEHNFRVPGVGLETHLIALSLIAACPLATLVVRQVLLLPCKFTTNTNSTNVPIASHLQYLNPQAVNLSLHQILTLYVTWVG
jgi:hypothetical protein